MKGSAFSMYLGKAPKLSLNVKIFASIISEENITPEIIDALCIVDDAFKENIETIRRVLVAKDNETVSAQELDAETDTMTTEELKEVAEEISNSGWGKAASVSPDIQTVEDPVEISEDVTDTAVDNQEDCNISKVLTEIEHPTSNPFDVTTDEEPVKAESTTAQRGGRGGCYPQKSTQDLIMMYPVTYAWFKNFGLEKLNQKTNAEIMKVWSTAKIKEKIGRNNFYRLCNHIKETGLEYKSKEIVNKKRSYIKRDFKYIPDDPDKETWKAYPDDPRIILSENGYVQFDGEFIKPTISHGLLVVIIERKAKALGKMMLETFKPIPGSKAFVCKYVDDNPLNIRIGNLYWERRNEENQRFTENLIREACEFIISHPDKTIHNLIALAVSEKKQHLTRALFENIFDSKYTKISEEYFTIRNNEIILAKDTAKSDSEPITAAEDSPVNIVKSNRGDIISIFKMSKDLDLAISLFKEKIRLGFELERTDLIIPILQFIKDDTGKIQSSSEIMNSIKFEYPMLKDKRLNSEFILDIKQKRFRKDLSDLVF